MKFVITTYQLLHVDPDDEHYYIVKNVETGEIERLALLNTYEFVDSVLDEEAEE
ncbi:MAG TPA: hypothetical protein VL854_09445 [Nitrososphaeraceae archaeon]|jgi:hypothetical protein|nr:hypothetical protein [Nitrososphaeraceae archaeon]